MIYVIITSKRSATSLHGIVEDLKASLQIADKLNIKAIDGTKRESWESQGARADVNVHKVIVNCIVDRAVYTALR